MTNQHGKSSHRHAAGDQGKMVVSGTEGSRSRPRTSAPNATSDLGTVVVTGGEGRSQLCRSAPDAGKPSASRTGVDDEDAKEEDNNTDKITASTPLRRSTRRKHLPSHLKYSETYLVLAQGENDLRAPRTFVEMLDMPNAKAWIAATDREYNAQLQNET